MKIVRVDHTSFTVSDIEQSNEFFAKLGFEPHKRYVSAGPDAEEGVGVPGADIDISWLKHPSGGPMLELLRYRNEATGTAPLNSKVGPPTSASASRTSRPSTDASSAKVSPSYRPRTPTNSVCAGSTCATRTATSSSCSQDP